MTKDDNTAREIALGLLRSGKATISEVAKLADVDRQLVFYWARVAGIDANKTRANYLAALWRKSLKR